MGSFKKYIQSGYRAYIITSAYLTAYFTKKIKKRRFATRARHAKPPAKSAPLGDQDQPRASNTPPDTNWTGSTEPEHVQIEAVQSHIEVDEEVHIPEVVEVNDGPHIFTQAHIEAAQNQTEADDELHEHEVVEFSELIWQSGSADKPDKNNTDSDDSDSDDEYQDYEDSNDSSDLDDSDSSDDSDDDSDIDYGCFQPIQVECRTSAGLYYPTSPNEDRKEKADGMEDVVEGKGKAPEVKGQLPDTKEWLGDDFYDYDYDYDYDDLPRPVLSCQMATLPSQRPPDVPPQTQLEPITVLDRADFTDPPDGQTILGRGAFGEVTLKYQGSTGRWVAYKSIIDGDHNATILEGQVMQLLSNHTSFPKVYGVVIQDDHKALVSEFVGDGLTACPLTLTDALSGKRSLELSQDEWCDIALNIIDGMWYMHRCNLLHHDIKTDNILLVEGINRWSARIIDFGHCRQSPTALVVPLDEESNQNTPLEAMTAAKVHWTTSSDVYGVGEILRLIGQHGNVPLLEERGTDLKKSAHQSSDHARHPEMEVVRFQLRNRHPDPHRAAD